MNERQGTAHSRAPMRFMSKTAARTDGPRSIGSRPNAKSSTHWRQRRHKPLRHPRSPRPQPTNPRGPRRNRPRRVRMPWGLRELRRNGPPARRKRRQTPSHSRAVRSQPERVRAERRRPEENGAQNTLSRPPSVATDKGSLSMSAPLDKSRGWTRSKVLMIRMEAKTMTPPGTT